jgi:uncharacterized membrane protein (UPF0136 family)
MSKGKDLNFIKHLVIASIIAFVLAVYPVYAYASKLQVYSIISGYVIGLLNALVGYKLNNLAFNKPVKSFMVIVFGGMGVRMMFIAITILILLYFAKLDEVSLVASVFFFYMLFVALEINYLHRKQLLNKKAISAE